MEEISEFLETSNIREHSCFYAKGQLPSSAVEVTVEDLGKLNFPLSEDSVKKLISISSKAKFGLGEQTLLDESVRDTNEIKADKLSVSIDNNSFTKMLNTMRQELGLLEKTVLEPNLYNMLIYGPDQFFEEHRDTEKINGMIATLVLVLPSLHSGGDLVIEHHKKQQRFCSSDNGFTNIDCFAFYTDCYHEIEEVEEGYRVVLTYNLVAKISLDLWEKDYMIDNITVLKEKFEIYFSAAAAEEDFEKWVCLLDHSYTEHSLRWNMLKGIDAKICSSLCNIAQQLNLIPHLALVEVHRSFRDCDDEYDVDVDKLAEEIITLKFWIGPDNEPACFGELVLIDEEVCFVTDTEKFKTCQEEVEYSGNEGYTADYRYQRAAIILWPAIKKVRINFILNYDNAKKEFFEMLICPEKVKLAIEIIEQAGHDLYMNDPTCHRKDFELFVEFCLRVDNEAVAFALLSNFDWVVLDSDIAEFILKLKIKYAADFIIKLLNNWKRKNRWDPEYHNLKNICAIVSQFVHYDIGIESIQLLLKKEWSSIQNSVENIKSECHYYSMRDHMNEIKQFLEACELVENYTTNIQTMVVDHLVKCSSFYTSRCKIYSTYDVLEMFLDLKNLNQIPLMPPYKKLKNYLLLAVLKHRTHCYRSEDDWSIVKKLPCRCKNCCIVAQFLQSKTQVKKIWSAEKCMFIHVKNKLIAELNLPVDVSPVNIDHVNNSDFVHNFVVTKHIKLHKDAKEEFDKLDCHLAKLREYID